MDEATKDQLTTRFRAYLDNADPAVSADIRSEQEPAPDLFTLLAEVAALKNEVKLEARQVKSALDQFRGLFDTLRDANARLTDDRDRYLEQERKTSQKAQTDLLMDMLELRDRLQAGHDQALRFRPRRMGGRAAPAFIASMAEGMAMNLRRLDESLARRGVHPLPVLGQTFDPNTMYAAELARDPKREEGLVLGELRKGFLGQGGLLRPAEVVVNRPIRTKRWRHPIRHLLHAVRRTPG
jgi:molecular chaperone GrpE